jgi:uncharacterized protein YecE (DUF72 family)
VKLFTGTSGFSYKEWKGSFYPTDLHDSEMLRYYAGRFPAVEINNTFYRMPRAEMLARWASETPEGFTFVLKAPQRITHQGRLRNEGDPLGYFLQAAETLGERLGPLLFQLPPFFQKDVERLRSFMAVLPPGRRAAFEFRHESWADPDVHSALREAGAALCVADTDEDEQQVEVVPTAGWGYLRLRRMQYTDEALRAWRDRIRAQPWDAAYVFFKHEDSGAGPDMGLRFMDAWKGGGGST